MNYAKALSNVPDFLKRWWPNRIHRKLDDRDFVLAAALKNLEARPVSIYPSVTHVDAATLAPTVGGGALTGLAIDGTLFLGDAVQATGETLLQTGEIAYEAVEPGEQTIVITHDITGPGAAVITADKAAGTILVKSDGAQTDDAVATAVNADPVAKFMVNATSSSAGAMDAAEVTTLSGGEGELLSLAVGPFPIDGLSAGNGITSVTDTEIVFDMNPDDMDGAATPLVAGDVYPVTLVPDGMKVDNMPNVVPA